MIRGIYVANQAVQRAREPAARRSYRRICRSKRKNPESMKSPSEIQVLAKLLGGVPILGIFPGSPAEQVGLMYGDIVLSVNGHTTKSFEDFLRAHTGEGTSVALQVFRDGRHLTFEISFRKEEWMEADDDELEEATPSNATWSAHSSRVQGLC